MGNLRFRRLREHQIGGSRDEMVLAMPVPRSPSGKIDQYSRNLDRCQRFVEDLAVVQTADKCSYVSRRGEVVWTSEPYPTPQLPPFKE